jgi:hypothetical protein
VIRASAFNASALMPPPASDAAHEKLSRRLAEVLGEAPPAGGVTMNFLLARTEGRGFYLLMILLCLPFAPLLSPPGLSALLGMVVFFMALTLALGARPRLPRFIGDRPLPPELHQSLRELLAPDAGARAASRGVRFALLKLGVKFLRFVERWCRPRKTRWLTRRLSRTVNALLIALLALLLALPLPSAPFFPTNGLPAYAIILLAAAMMEEDGVLIWVAYAVALATLVFFGSIAGMIVEVIRKLLAAS